MGRKMWIWLLPIAHEMKGQGLYYPKVPEITMSDLNILLKDASRVHGTSFTVNDFDFDPKEYVNKSVQKYAGNKFIIKGGPENQEAKEIYIPRENEI